MAAERAGKSDETTLSSKAADLCGNGRRGRTDGTEEVISDAGEGAGGSPRVSTGLTGGLTTGCGQGGAERTGTPTSKDSPATIPKASPTESHQRRMAQL